MLNITKNEVQMIDNTLRHEWFGDQIINILNQGICIPMTSSIDYPSCSYISRILMRYCSPNHLVSVAQVVFVVKM